MHAKKRKFPFGILLSVLVLAVVALVGTAVAKYVYSEPLTVRVQFEAKLADTVALLESKAERQPDGSYKLGTGTAYENSYILMPGVDISKDPYVLITGKTSIPAYLFVEVVDKIGDDAISWEIGPAWLKLEGGSGHNGGNVYVYKGNESEALKLTDENCPEDKIYVLNNNTVYVGQKLVSNGEDINGGLKFYASLVQVGKTGDADRSPQDAYNSLNP